MQCLEFFTLNIYCYFFFTDLAEWNELYSQTDFKINRSPILELDGDQFWSIFQLLNEKKMAASFSGLNDVENYANTHSNLSPIKKEPD